MLPSNEESAVIKLAKHSILHVLDRFGYHLLKTADHQALLAQAAAEDARPTETPTQTHPVPFTAAVTAPPVADPAVIPPPFGDPSFTVIRQRVIGREDFSIERLHALYSAAKHITAQGIAGDILDCGWGDTTSLLVTAASLLQLGQAERRLVLFDVSVGPLHSVEYNLAPWGADYDLLRKPRLRPLPSPEPLLTDLAESGYPAEQILVRRYPREPIAYEAPIAFLSMTAESYDANRHAFEMFYPRLAPGGILAVEDSNPEGNRANFISAFLRDIGVSTPLSRVCSNFCTLVKPDCPSQ